LDFSQKNGYFAVFSKAIPETDRVLGMAPVLKLKTGPDEPASKPGRSVPLRKFYPPFVPFMDPGSRPKRPV
jgi:hypothetical protein